MGEEEEEKSGAMGEVAKRTSPRAGGLAMPSEESSESSASGGEARTRGGGGSRAGGSGGCRFVCLSLPFVFADVFVVDPFLVGEADGESGVFFLCGEVEGKEGREGEEEE
jgi:hypothetical protein